MKHRLVFSSLLVLFLALAPTALASSTWYVDGVNGSDNNNCKSPQTACKTIGHAISLASSGDSIMVAAATYKENLTIKRSLKVVGSGASTTIIDGGLVNTVVTISNANSHVTLSKLTIRNGSANLGGGIYNLGTLTLSDTTVSENLASFSSKPPSGGGIYNSGTLTINSSTLSGNRAVNFAKDGHTAGGGIYNLGTLTISNSTLSGNSAGAGVNAFGGGIYSSGTLTISNSTLSGNFASGNGNYRAPTIGGGIAGGGGMTISNSTFSGNYTVGGSNFGGGILSGGTLAISNSTFSGNSAGCCGGGVDNNAGTLTISNSTFSGNSAYIGGGIIIRGTATLQNSIVANSQKGGNCSGTITSDGYNLSSDNTCNFNNTGDLNNTDPKLGTLGNYGGPTQTIPLLSGSPAIDAGNPNGCTDGNGHLLKTDQRGKPRPDKEDTGGCDMGAFERQSD